MKRYALLALPMIAIATPASAQAPLGGFRVEGIVGYDQLDLDFDEGEFESFQPTGKLDGTFFGGTLGYDFAMGGVMLGVDAEYTSSTADRTFFGVGVDAEGDDTDADLKFKRDLYVGGRATFAMSPVVNAYGKLGYTRLSGSVELDEAMVGDFVDFHEDDLDGNLDGIRAGIGVTYSPMGQVYYGLELRYSNYEAGVDRKQAGLVVGYRF